MFVPGYQNTVLNHNKTEVHYERAAILHLMLMAGAQLHEKQDFMTVCIHSIHKTSTKSACDSWPVENFATC
jgi:hypothetical protein